MKINAAHAVVLIISYEKPVSTRRTQPIFVMQNQQLHVSAFNHAFLRLWKF